MRLNEIFVALLCILFGGLTFLTSLAMIIGMFVMPDTYAKNLFWVSLIALALSPPVFIAGFRLLLNKPNKHGGLFSPSILRFLAIINGVLGGLIFYFALEQQNINGILGAISFLITTQGAFALANNRKTT